MIDRPAHGGYPGEVLVRVPATDAHGLLPLGSAWTDVETLRSMPDVDLAELTGATVEEVRQARGFDG